MKRLAFGSLLGSMLAVAPLVNSQENVSPKINPPSPASKNDIAQLVDFLLKNGEENPFKEYLAPVVGLPGPMPAKGQTISEEHHGKDKDVHECYVVYEPPSDATGSQSQHPVCLYLHRRKVSGHDDESQYFRINLKGQLDKVVMILAKRDDNGNPVPGSGSAHDQDIASSESKKEFAAEMIAMRKWLKTQQKLLLAKATAPAASASAVAAP
jgi:hypothetical protein